MDKYDRQEVESVHDRREGEFCSHKHADGRGAFRVLLGRLVAVCSICGEENDLNPLCTPPLRVQREEVSTFEEIAKALLIEAIIAQERKERREQAKYLDAGDL